MENMTGAQKVIFKATVKFHMQHGLSEQMAIQKGMEKIAQMKRLGAQMKKENFCY
jgi:hypothetical protein